MPEELTLKDVLLGLGKTWRFLISKWMVILTLSVCGGLAGYWYAYFKKPTFTSNITFVLEDGGTSGGLGNLGGLASFVGINVGDNGSGGIFQGDNIIELYKSQAMIEKALFTEVPLNGKKSLLINRYIEFHGLRKTWKEVPALANVRFDKAYAVAKAENGVHDRTRDSLVTSIVKEVRNEYLNVSKIDKKLSVINAEVKAEDEVFAKEFNDQIVKTVNDFYIQTKTKKSLENVAILQHNTDSVRAVMNGSIYTSAAISDATPNLNPTRQVQRVAPMQRSQFSAETNKIILGELLKNLEISKIALRKETPLIQIIDKSGYPLQKRVTSKAISFVIGFMLLGFMTATFLVIRKLILNAIS
jgi:hypothetical protein